jgi:SAM-dependent methyltransferase
VPNPALSDALKDKASIIGQPLHSDGRRKRALVPGCGKGYDVLLLAAAGYDAIGLDLEGAIQQANSFTIEAWGRKEYDVWDERIGRGELEFVDGDFYKEDWEKEVGEGGFDVIYDYTVSLLFNNTSCLLFFMRHKSRTAQG